MHNGYKSNYDKNSSKQRIKGKAILLGESGVGKTCLIRRLIDNIYNVVTPTTFGSSTFEKKYVFNNIELKLDIWDTAGQELYRSLNHIFYRDANIVLFVYDITNRRSFEEMKNYWIREVENTCEIDEPILGVAANKCDLLNHVEVEEIEGKKFAKDINAIFHETSASNDVGIEDLFEKLARNYVIASLKGNEIKEKGEKNNLSLNKAPATKKKKCCD